MLQHEKAKTYHKTPETSAEMAKIDPEIGKTRSKTDRIDSGTGKLDPKRNAHEPKIAWIVREIERTPPASFPARRHPPGRYGTWTVAAI